MTLRGDDYSDARFCIRVPSGWSVERSQEEFWDALYLEGKAASVQIRYMPSGALSPMNAVSIWETRVLDAGRSLGRWEVERTVAGVQAEGFGHSISSGWLRRRQVVEGFAGRLHRRGVLSVETWRVREVPEAVIVNVLDSLRILETSEEVALSAAPLSPSLDELFAGEDFELCDGIFCRYDALNPDAHAERCEEPERVIGLVWYSMGLIGNGGFSYLFSAKFRGDPEFALTVAAYEMIGAQGATAAFREALGKFPNSTPQDDLEERRAHFAAVPADEQGRIERDFYSASPEIEACLARYIREHRSEIERAIGAYEARR